MHKLNLGAGSSKLKDFINIDCNTNCNPDMVHDFIKEPLPFEDNSCSEVVLFHTIEHIEKKHHHVIFNDIWRVLKPGCIFILSFPEFRKCIANWESNYNNQKEFWEATIYGLQRYESDYHVSIADTNEISQLLRQAGFSNVLAKPEPEEPYNTFITCFKGPKLASYEDTVRQDMNQWLVENRKGW